MDRTACPPRPWIAWIGLIALASGCSTLGDRGKTLVPTGFQARTGPYLISSNRKIEPDAPVVRQLRSVESEIQETLGLKVEVGDNPVEVYILDDRQAFAHFLQFYYPDIPPRRAFFLAGGEKRQIYTYFGDRLEEDLRHESTHALLHVAVGDIPLWLDEGLAEYFEGPADRGGVNAEHLVRLPADLQGGWTPDLARLESLRSVRQLSPRDYRESWAWVHYLLNDTRAHKAALLGYLADLRASPAAPPISQRLEGPTAGPLVAHIGRIPERPIASAPAKDPTVRLQSAGAEPGLTMPSNPASPARKRGFLARVLGIFGS